jgi:RNA polymerase sigma-70 factor (ECF subfamily)
MGETDQERVSRCRAGSQDAYRELVETYHQRVYRTAYALVGNPADAAEVEQETFVKAWRALGSFRGQAALGTWLTRLAVNAARDHLRRKRARDLLDQLLAHRRLLAQQKRGEDTLEGVEQHDALADALKRLAPALRQALALYYGAELSVREIAEVLGCPEGTIKWRLSTGIAKLRDLLDPDRAPGVQPRPWRAVDP